MLLQSIQHITKWLFSYFGYELKRSNKGLSVKCEMTNLFSHTKELGFYPKTIFDVGVGKGTFPIYESFPNSFHLLIEPLQEFENEIINILGNLKGKAYFAAASSYNGEAEINIHQDHLEGSSLLKENMGPEFDGTKRKVRVIKMDTILKDENLKGPFMIKVDVQGAELDVLEGGKEVLRNTELVLLEVSLFGFMRESPQLVDVVKFMKDLGFVVYDIYSLTRRPLDNALAQCDLAFVKENGFFRKDHNWATPEQWRIMTS